MSEQDELTPHEVSTVVTAFQKPAPDDSADAEQECAIFQASMAERIGAGEDLQHNPHMLTCERCRSLMSELETIVGAIRESFPTEVEPRDDLWSKIESKLALEKAEEDSPNAAADQMSGDSPIPGDLALEGGVA